MTRLGDVQRNETRCETRSTLLTVLLWLVTAVIVVAMLLRMLPNNLDGKRYVPLVVALIPWLGLLSTVIAVFALTIRRIGKRRMLAALSAVCVVIQVAWHWGVYCAGCQPCRTVHGNSSCYDVQHEAGCCRCATNR